MAGKRRALLVANANYQHSELRKLNAPPHDVRALETLLARRDIGGYEIEVLVDATKLAIEKAIDRMLGDSDRDDLALIFFGGHGIKRDNGKLYFAVADTEPERLGSTAVAASWLVEEMQNSRVGSQIVLLDCCFGGAFARGSLLRGDIVESGEALEVPELEQSGRGQVIITAADTMQFAFEADVLEGQPPASHFVRALTEGLQTGEADACPQDGRVTIDELASYLVRRLKALGSPQRPRKWVFGAAGDELVFAYNPRVNAAIGADNLSTLPVDWERQVKRFLEAKDYKKAVPLLQKASELGDLQAMVSLGELYEKGRAVSADVEQAHKWYRKAAEAGIETAMWRLGELYHRGFGASEDHCKAFESFKKAAEAGNVQAMKLVAGMYRDGLGTPKDEGKEFEWFQKAAEVFDLDAMKHLAGMYATGQGTPKDDGKEFEWFQKAAEAGDHEAMTHLGTMYDAGRGTPQDYAKARKWYQEAAVRGNWVAMLALSDLYENGRGVSQDQNQADHWFEKAAEKGVGMKNELRIRRDRHPMP